MNKKFFIIYKTINLINDKYYIGKYTTRNLNDGYLGSGTYLNLAIKKYGKENFKRKILFYCDSLEELNEKEKEIVNEKLVNDKMCYNLVIGGIGSFDHINENLVKEERDKFKIKNKISLKGETNFMYKKCWVYCNGQNLVIDKNELQNYLDNGWLKGRLIEYKKIQCKFCNKNISICQIKIHIEHCYLNPDKIRRCPICNEPIKFSSFDSCSKTCGAKNKYRSGKCWVYSSKEEKEIIVDKNNLQDYLNKGWTKGRK